MLLYIQTEVKKGNILIFSFNTPATTTTTTTTTETIKQFSTRVKKKKI